MKNKNKKVKETRWEKIKNSKPFLTTIMLAIGISGAMCYYEGKDYYEWLQEGLSYTHKEISIKDVGAKVKVLKPEAETHASLDGKCGEGFEPATPVKELGEFSAYNALQDQTDGNPTVMASGKKVYEGAIACPAMYDFGDKIEIEGLGIYTCEDRMAERYRYTNHFDLFMWDYSDAISFGRKELAFKKI